MQSEKKINITLQSCIAALGAKTIDFLNFIGKFVIFCSSGLKCVFTPPFYWKIWREQFFKIGYLSLPVIGLTALFTGAVLALQSYSGFSRFSAESSIPTVVVLSITRELGPVLGGLMVAARVGASMAAEISTMKVTEQISALITLSANPFKYVVAPRIIAGIICMPLLILIADIIGIFGGYLVSVHYLGFIPQTYLKNTFEFLKFSDVMSGLIKAIIFGFIITAISCFNGYNASGGAEGVGRGTINSVVSCAIMILLFNYIITSILF